jgi:hypothetical protein
VRQRRLGFWGARRVDQPGPCALSIHSVSFFVRVQTVRIELCRVGCVLLGPDEIAAKPRKLTVVQAAADGTHRELLAALRARIAAAVQAPSCNPVALAALSRQLVLLSKELSVIDARAEDEADEAAAIPDEPWDGAV